MNLFSTSSFKICLPHFGAYKMLCTQRIKNRATAPIVILKRPIRRIFRSSTVAITSTMLRHLDGDRKGMMPSNTNIRQIAVATSFSISITQRKYQCARSTSSKSAQKNRDVPGFAILAKSPTMWQEFLR
jgi:hypothetical protein